MKKLFASAMLAGSLMLSGCGTTGGIDTGQITAIEQQVIAATQQVCGFVPTVETVANILATFVGGGPIVAVISQVANGICGAVVSSASTRFGARLPIYRGVVIHGARLR